MPKCLIFFAILVASPSIAPAQFWHALPHVDTNRTVSACFSNDEKKVFYLSKDGGGIANIWGMTVADKYARIIAGPANPPAQITKFTDRSIVRFFHLLNRPEILYMRLADNGKDYHIYKITDDGSGQPEDLTPGGEGVTSEIIGASYNGRFVYYTNNKVSHDKVDVYRYDTQQFTSDIVFPNDKDYVALAWTRDQNKLLILDPRPEGMLSLYDISTTEKTPLANPPDDAAFTTALLDPTGHELIMLENGLKSTTEIGGPKEVKTFVNDPSIYWMDYSPNGKYIIIKYNYEWVIKDAKNDSSLTFPKGYIPLAIAPKETMLIYSLPSSGNASKIFLYDIAKNSSTELATVR